MPVSPVYWLRGPSFSLRLHQYLNTSTQVDDAATQTQRSSGGMNENIVISGCLKALFSSQTRTKLINADAIQYAHAHPVLGVTSLGEKQQTILRFEESFEPEYTAENANPPVFLDADRGDVCIPVSVLSAMSNPSTTEIPPHLPHLAPVIATRNKRVKNTLKALDTP
ncbi:hypothetical protein AAF712_007814 [Marasmius tenuissimus]|uniref:Uncharacterized protein n=1 Tax=Marasmius tenuissimus TaxID=585030 RepID=A0ABR2ZVQ1_9AGAR